MLFQITHTHSHETCPAVHPERLRTLIDWWQALQAMPEIKVRGAYASPLDHVLYVTVEASDFATVVRAMGPLNALGTGETAAVLPMDELLAIAQERQEDAG